MGERQDFEQRLRTLGVTDAPSSLDVALDQTITPETFAAQRGPVESVGPLPRISLGGIEPSDPSATGTRPLSAGATADLEILSLLGEGGMGRVHLARQRSLGREVAIKTLKEEVVDARSAEMLRAEATTMGRLEHPNVVPVHAVGLDDHGRLLLVMKRIEGVSWHDLVRAPDHPRWASLTTLPEVRLDAHLEVLGHVANALHFAHSRGVIHRDVKPENVLLGEHGEVYLADWGIALRMDRPPRTELVGTPAYMAPEMAVGDTSKIDARTDVYLLGATLHELLTGAPPHAGATLHATLLAAFESRSPVYDASIPAELAAIARRALASDPDERFESALAFRRALDALRRHRGSIALAQSARVLLGELAGDAGKKDTDRKLTECRFAFVQALRDWPENVDARAGLDACLLRAVRHELSRDNAEAARGLLSELSSPSAAFEAEIEALEAKLAVRAKETERLRALEADADLWVGMGARVGVFATLLLFTLVITTTVLVYTGGDAADMSIGDALGISLGLSIFLGASIVVFRKRLLANAVGRRVSALLMLSMVALFVHRAAGAAFDVPVGAVLAMDMVLLATVAASAGVLVPRGAWAAVVPLAGLVWAILDPSRIVLVFSLVTLATLLVVIALWLFELMRARKSA